MSLDTSTDNPVPAAAPDGGRLRAARAVRAVRARLGGARAGGPWLRETAAATGAALVSMAAYCLAMAVHGTYPFGPRSRAVNDLANQFVPYHAHLWDLQHGTGSGDLFFNWNSGFGAPFLPDFFAYLCNPLSWLTGLFPRGDVDLAVFVATLLSAGLAAAAMTLALGRLRPGSPWLRALLATGYALCAWTVNDGSTDPMWLWGLVGLPLLVVASDWCLRERHWLWGVLLVAVVWGGNFYTGAMATLAAALVLVLRLAVAAAPPRVAGRVLLRAVAMTVTGMLLVAPVLTVSLAATHNAQPAPPAVYRRNFGALDYLAQLLPAGRAPMSAPNIAAGVLVLLLVAALPFHRGLPLRERVAWYVLLPLVAASFVWRPTVLLWHGLAVPNGSAYRAAFVLSGLLVMAAWVCLAARPGPAALLPGAAVLAVLMLLVHGRPSVHRQSWYAVAGGGAFFLVCLLALHLLRRRRAPRWAKPALGAVLAAGVLLASAQSVWSSTVLRDKIAWFRPLPTMNANARQAYGLVQGADAWPDTRTEPGGHFADNDPMLLDAQGGGYYSSYTPATTAQFVQSLGMGWRMQGRRTLSADDPVNRALLGVGRFLERGPNGSFSTRSAPAAPMVSVHPALPPAAADSVFARQEQLLGARVYRIPELRPGRGAVPLADGDQWRVPRAVPGRPWAHFTATCTPGSQVYVDTPWLRGWILGLDTQITSHGIRPVTGTPLQLLGTVPADGRLDIAFAGRLAAQDIPQHAVGCLNRAALTAAVARLHATGATRVDIAGHRISAQLPPGSRGFAVAATVLTDGWSCSRDGHGVRPVSYGGLLAVPLGTGASRVSCGFTPPGLTKGLALSGVGALAVLGVLLAPAVRRRLDAGRGRTRDQDRDRDRDRTGDDREATAPGS